MGSAHASTVLDADRTGGLMGSAHVPTVSMTLQVSDADRWSNG